MNFIQPFMWYYDDGIWRFQFNDNSAQNEEEREGK